MRKIICALAVVAALAGCDSAAEKAAKNFAAAKELVSQGDIPRALVELRNALKNDETLTDARMMLADLLLQQDRKGDAFGQYRAIVEKDPANLQATRALAEISFDAMAWDDAEKYTSAGLALAATDPGLLAVQVGLEYRKAVSGHDSAEMERSAFKGSQLLLQHPELLRARRVVLSDLVQRGDLKGALAQADAGLVLSPKDRDLNNVRLVVLGRLNDKPAMEKQILSMVALYPDDEEVGRLLVEFYLSTNRAAEAEAWLRSRIKPDTTDPGPRKVLLQFLAQVRSLPTMRDELAQALAQKPLPADIAGAEIEFRMMKSAADFSLGQKTEAMAALEALLEGAEPSAQIDQVKVQLARMRLATDNPVGARALVEEVLAHDPGQNGAIKLKSAWLIEDDNSKEAIRLLRDGLADAPEDSQLMTLLADAYEREGRPELIGDMLARAVEASRQAAPESLRYASYLAKKGDTAGAETVLIDALRRSPDRFELLVLLGQVHLSMRDWPRTEQDIAAIRERFQTPQATAAADELQARMLQGRGQGDALNAFLGELVQKAPQALAPRIALIRTTAQGGNVDQALKEAQALATEMPNAPEAQLLLGQVQLAANKSAEGLATLQALVQAHPDFEDGWQTLYAVQAGQGDKAGADATLAAALKALPDSRALLIMQAGVLERSGDIAGAIAVYETLYGKNSNDMIVANNLASLLASTRSDQASLDRAWAVARRLNGSDVPPFQDTYGWLAFRRGDTAAALAALEPAAKGLPSDPSVAYHLAQTYAALGRKEDAAAEYKRGADLLAKGAPAYPGLDAEITAGLAALGQK